MVTLTEKEFLMKEIPACRECNRDLADGEMNAHRVGLCEDCYDFAGLENEHVDGNHEDNPDPECPLCNDKNNAQGEEVTPLITWNDQLESRYVQLRDGKRKFTKDETGELRLLLMMRDTWLSRKLNEKGEK